MVGLDARRTCFFQAEATRAAVAAHAEDEERIRLAEEDAQKLAERLALVPLPAKNLQVLSRESHVCAYMSMMIT